MGPICKLRCLMSLPYTLPPSPVNLNSHSLENLHLIVPSLVTLFSFPPHQFPLNHSLVSISLVKQIHFSMVLHQVPMQSRFPSLYPWKTIENFMLSVGSITIIFPTSKYTSLVVFSTNFPWKSPYIVHPNPHNEVEIQHISKLNILSMWWFIQVMYYFQVIWYSSLPPYLHLFDSSSCCWF